MDLLVEPIDADGLVIFFAAGPAGSKLVEEDVEVSEGTYTAISESSCVMEASLRLPADVVEANVRLSLSSLVFVLTFPSVALSLRISESAVSLSEGGGIACIAEKA